MRTCLPVLLLALWPGPVYAQGLHGACFQVEHGAWTPEADLRGDSILLLLPSRVRFTATPARGNLRPGFLQLEVVAGGLSSIHPVRGWLEEGDTIRVAWSNRYSGVAGALVNDVDDLRGVLRTFWDYEQIEQTAPAVFRSVDCDAPHSASEVAASPIPRSISLVDGTVLRLGDPLGGVGGVERDPGRRDRYLFDVEVEGIGLVSRLLLRPNSAGQIRRIQFDFPTEESYQAWFESVRELLGPPGESDMTMGEHFTQMWIWQNRETSYVLRRFSKTEGGIGYSIALSDWSLDW